jgi:hypothetical protein
MLGIMQADPIKNFFMINKVKLIKLICSGYLESKSASPRLLGPVDYGWFTPYYFTIALYL